MNKKTTAGMLSEPLSYQKRNRREEYTLRVIRESFLELLKKKPIEKIRVGELCEKADINRSTFYRHYVDLYALLDSIVEECHHDLFHKVISTIDFSGEFEKDGYSYILQMCSLTDQNKELYRMLLFGHTKTHFMQKVIDTSFQLYFGKHTSSSYLSAPEVYLHYQYLIHGIVGVWISWLQENCDLPKEKVAQVIKDQISAFFHKMNELYLSTDTHTMPSIHQSPKK